MEAIPTDLEKPFWRQITNLEGTDFILEFRYNQREDLYYLKISLTDETVLAQGIKLVSNYRLLQAYADSRMPAGELIALAQGTDDSPARLFELGSRVTLYYVTKAELLTAGKDNWRTPT